MTFHEAEENVPCKFIYNFKSIFNYANIKPANGAWAFVSWEIHFIRIKQYDRIDFLTKLAIA